MFCCVKIIINCKIRKSRNPDFKTTSCGCVIIFVLCHECVIAERSVIRVCLFFLFLQDSIGLLLDAVRTSNEDLAQTWKKSEQWATIEQLCSKSALINEGILKHFCSQFSFCTRQVA